MDADLQNDPADIPAMLALFDQGYGMAIGMAQKTAGYRLQALASKIANAIRNRITRESVRDTGCSLKIMRRELLLRIPRFKGMHRYLPTLYESLRARAWPRCP
jgi:hypothetical protein